MKTVMELRDVSLAGEHAECTALADEELAYFKGHFPAQPVFPAICQIETVVLPLTVRAWPTLGALRRLSRLKFRRPIAPGQLLHARVDLASSTRVRFAVSVEGEVASSGVLEFGGES